MKRCALIVLLLAFSPTVAKAGPQEVAAALPNEQAECRYLLNLCKRADTAPDGAEALQRMSEAGQAAQVIRAKHEKMPACFSKCGILDLKKFR